MPLLCGSIPFDLVFVSLCILPDNHCLSGTLIQEACEIPHGL